ncbi:MAG TPA: hypothetical protein PKE04_05910, partial [Clostridia bacterium]|nr:hypothetical protein [Clostridia bacterium]
MKRFWMLLSCIAMMMLAAMPCALANSWGLTGDLLAAVSSDPAWDDYYALNRQAGDAAVMHSRYHNALMVVTDLPGHRLQVCTKAVYQPEDERDGEMQLTKTEAGLTLAYGENERYTFSAFAGKYELKEAVIGAFSMTATIEETDDGRIVWYEASDGEATAIWRGGVSLNDFNIRLFPRSIDEVRHLNLMRASLDSGEDCLGWWEDFGEPGIPHRQIGTGTEPVYASPFGASSWRAANGKAAVGLSGELWSLLNYRNADDEEYACIRYDVSERTQRIGYIRAEAIGGDAAKDWDPENDFLNVGVCAIRDTYLTDDPDVSQYPQLNVPEGTQFACMGLYNRDYAYVAAEVRDGRFVDGGEIVWGFVPLKALAPDKSDPFRRERQADVMKSMAGEWVFYAGGNMAEDELALGADGTYTGRYCDWNSG